MPILKKAKYFINKAVKDQLNPLIYSIGSNNNTESLDEYYFLFDRYELLKGGSYHFKFDEKEIPMVKGHFTDTDGGYFYNPQAVGQYALAIYNEYINTSDENLLNYFVKLSYWFKDNYEINKGIPYWPLNKDVQNKVYGFDNKDQIISSMSQSRAISVLLRAYQETSNLELLNLVESAMEAYKKTPEEGGFLEFQNNLTLFEEPSQPKILNHIIFSHFGLNDYCRFKGCNSEYQTILENSIISIKSILDNYDLEWWSLYDDFIENGKRRYNPCTRHYHFIHIRQLEVLYEISEDIYFKNKALKWLKYDKSYFNRMKMLKEKFVAVREMQRI